jgi:Family of unknown function (DUF6186)
MTWRPASFTIWAVLASALVVTEALARALPRRLPTLDVAFRRAMSSRAVRAALLLAWMWIGWHTFAR